MDLKTFVSETLAQIVEGVKEAQPRVNAAGGKVHPHIVGAQAEALAKHKIFVASGGYAQFVEFDVAVTASEGTGTKGGVAVVAGILSLGSGGESKNENSASSRVRFMVPLVLPQDNPGR
jgi:hypothetical protein